MFTLAIADPFATKGVEYLLVLTSLAALLIFWHILASPPLQAMAGRLKQQAGGWFRILDGLRYHPGQTWVRQMEPGLVRVGLNDFAQKLLGPIGQVVLPPAGEPVAHDQSAWQVAVGGHAFRLLSPVTGRILRTNPAVLRDPSLVNSDPYGAGWLVELRPAREGLDTDLLTGPDSVRRWLHAIEAGFRRSMAPELGAVLQDGGTPVDGIARALAPTHWEEMVATLLKAEVLPSAVEAPDHESEN